MLLYQSISRVAKCIYKIGIKGQEHIPNEGSFILCPNHRSIIDPALLTCVLSRKTFFMAKQELFVGPMKPMLIRMGAFPVNRQSGKGALIYGRKLLNQGHPICMFPEGTRNKEATMKPLKSGCIRLAASTQSPLIPIFLSGKHSPFSSITINIGKPLEIRANHSLADSLSHLEAAYQHLKREST